MVAPIAAHPPEISAWKSRVGLSPAGTVSLAAVVAVLVFVSLARLRPLMTHENEVDASQTVQLLAAQLDSWRAERGNQSLVPSLEELAAEATVRQALSDGLFEEDGRVLKRHGYLFTVVELPPLPAPQQPESGTVQAAESSPPPLQPQLGVRAWPWKHGSSGRLALVCTADGRVFRHANTPPLWSGAEAAAELSPDWTGWSEN